MAESTPASADPSAADAPNIVFNFDKLYVKDMSIEVPHAPRIFFEQESPSLETALNMNADNFEDGLYEIVLTATVTTRVKDKVAFLVEVAQAGIFEIRNFPADQVDPLIGIHCAGILFPYLRAHVADLVTRAGFPVLHLPNVNFEAFYAQRLEQLRQQGAAGPTSIVTPPTQ